MIAERIQKLLEDIKELKIATEKLNLKAEAIKEAGGDEALEKCRSEYEPEKCMNKHENEYAKKLEYELRHKMYDLEYDMNRRMYALENGWDVDSKK
jgi:glutamyl-tRNA reductase